MSRINKKYLINLHEDDMDQPIYHYIKFDYLYELLKSKKNTLVKPFKWNDPFENFMSNLNIHDTKSNDFPITLLAFQDAFYAQCWTMKKECDLMWQSYVHHNGVKLETTIRRLYNSITEQSLAKIKEITGKNAEVYIGKVKYLQKNELLNSGFFDLKKLVSKWPISVDEMAKTLFVKRKEFQSEEEIRIVLNTNCMNEENYQKDKLDIPFNDLIDEIVIAPKISNDIFLCYKEVIEKLRFTGKIKHSDLYKFDDFEVQVGDIILSSKLINFPKLGKS